MGIYVFSWKALRRYLTEDEADPGSENDFGKNIIPKMLADGQRMAAYPLPGLLEGRRYPHLPLGCQHGYALSGIRPGPV